MKAKAKIELDVLLEDVTSLEDAKAHLRTLLGKFKKVAQRSRVTALDLEVSDSDISDLIEEED